MFQMSAQSPHIMAAYLQQVLQVCWDLAADDSHIHLATRHHRTTPSRVLHLQLHRDLPVRLLEALCTHEHIVLRVLHRTSVNVSERRQK